MPVRIRAGFSFLLSLSIVLAVLAPVRPLLIKYTIHDVIQRGADEKALIMTLLINITLIQVLILLVETGFGFISPLSLHGLGRQWSRPPDEGI